MSSIFAGIMIPFIGTTAGAACVFFLKNALKPSVQKAFLGFASGVMVAASVWSLLIPSMDMSGHMGKLAFIPASVGFLLGMVSCSCWMRSYLICILIQSSRKVQRATGRRVPCWCWQ